MDKLDAIFNYVGIVHLLSTLAVLYPQCCMGVLQGPTDYCFLEVFEPRCSENEVILIDKALYGRMEAGKCLEADDPKIGCYANVQRIIDNLCSGKSSCSVQVIHPDLVYTNPCSSVKLSSYLTVAYSCIEVQNRGQSCQGQTPLHIKGQKGFLAGSSSYKNCPVILTATKGTRFNLTLYNFLKPKERSACYEVASIKEGPTQKTLHACENNERSKVVHISSSSTLEITFTHSSEMAQLGNFLIYYEAMGCPSPPVPEDAHAIREGDTATIVCNNSDTTWTTTCKDNKWTQQDRECPGGWSLTEIVKTTEEFPYGVFLTSIIGVGLGVLIGGFLLFLAVNAFQRYQRRGQQYGPPPVIPDPDYKIYDTARMDLSFVPGFGHNSTLPRHQMAAADVPPAPPPLSEETMKRLSRHTYERPNFPKP